MAHAPSTDVTRLTTQTCWQLLRGAEVGRLAVVTDGRPDIFPVNYVVDHGGVVFRTGPGSKLVGVLGAPDVAFEADGYDPAAHEAWSVVLKGPAREITGLYDLLETVALPLHPWHAPSGSHFVRIEPDELTGRRFPVAAASTWDSPLQGVRPVAAD